MITIFEDEKSFPGIKSQNFENLQSVREVLNVAKGLMHIAKCCKKEKTWVIEKLKLLKEYANSLNIMDYPQYKGEYKNEVIYLGRCFVLDEEIPRFNFRELYAQDFMQTILLSAKSGFRASEEDATTVENLSKLNEEEFHNFPEHFIIAYRRYVNIINHLK